VPAPLFDISSHVIGADGADSAIGAYVRRSMASEVAGRYDLRGLPGPRGPIPMVQGREALAGEFGEGSCFVPAHTGDRIIALPLRIVAQFPCGRTRPSSPIVEPLHRSLKREGVAVFFVKPIHPVFWIGVASSRHKLFVLSARNFVLVHPIAA